MLPIRTIFSGKCRLQRGRPLMDIEVWKLWGVSCIMLEGLMLEQRVGKGELVAVGKFK